MTDTVNILCMICGEPSYLGVEEAHQTNACPKCGDTGLPADLSDIVTVTLTAHELRILTFWAEGYARLSARVGWDTTSRMPKVLRTILDRLAMQTDTPLSLSQDMADVRNYLATAHEHPVELVLVDETGTCLECGGLVDLDNFFEHNCGPTTKDTDEHRSETETEDPDHSS